MDQTKQKQPVYPSELATAATAERQAEAKTLPEFAKAGRSSPVEEFVEFLKQTKRVWLIVVGGIFGLILLFTLGKRVYEWASNARERRQERAVASVTPERLLARCGQAAEDTTKEVFPILMRTMTYQVSRNETYVFSFSRTAEDKSDWVFLSMKDASGGKSYDTPEEKVGAMSCLNSRK